MIFIHRLGIVLYWVGFVLAILFAIGRPTDRTQWPNFWRADVRSLGLRRA
jgi:hypothetical protein